MIHWTNLDKYTIIKSTCYDAEGGCHQMVGITNYGLLQEIADKLGMRGNTGGNLRSVWARIIKIMRELIKDGYPIVEYRIKACSWSSRETWHPLFGWKEEEPYNDGTSKTD